jgi:rhamnose utilization protein RhaD (predicted bifunctional aldolase and dehydrogenase)
MRSLWSDGDAEAMVRRFGESVGPGPAGRDVALRVYTSRLLGGDPRLVLHGGGNTSVKTVLPDLLGDPVEVLCVKGSGWDMAEIEPPGLPAVRLAPLARLRERTALSDEDMVRIQRANLIDPGAPNPSVETLLHAFLPHKFIDHTHAAAVLSLADQPDAAERCADLYGGRVGIVPYIMPGFLLAKKAAELFEADPTVEGLILLKHGVFSFGDDARAAYERMIAIVSLAEERLARGRRNVFVPARLPAALAKAAEIAPILRGACALPDSTMPGIYKRFVLDFRNAPRVVDFVSGAELPRYGQAGVATPDHTIRTKNSMERPISAAICVDLISRYRATWRTISTSSSVRRKGGGSDARRNRGLRVWLSAAATSMSQLYQASDTQAWSRRVSHGRSGLIASRA